jgi:parallel beta helix pectate lyase-like protein
MTFEIISRACSAFVQVDNSTASKPRMAALCRNSGQTQAKRSPAKSTSTALLNRVIEDHPMKKVLCSLVRTTMIVFFLPSVSQAAPGIPQMRTYVSGLGSDTNPCTVSLPCSSFRAALAATAAGGEIYVLNSANYGAMTINKAVTITSEGAVAGVLATSGVGLTIRAGAGDVINLRGLDIDGGNSGSTGIQFVSGQALNIQKSLVHGFANSGIIFSPAGTASLSVSDTTVTSNHSNGILVTGPVNGALNRVTASGNGVGIFASGAGVSLTLTDIVASNNSYGVGASASAMMVRNSTMSSNALGMSADRTAVVRVSQSTITANGTGLEVTNGGQVLSFGNNNISGNGTDGLTTTTVAMR